MTMIPLNILIPTRNRYDHLEHCIAQFLDLSLLLTPWVTVSITVSDNSQTQFYDPEFSSRFPSVNFVRPPAELLSAEENLYFGLQKVGPGIIWFFGDDDLFETQLSALFLEILKKFQANPKIKAIFFHNHFIDAEGNLLYSQIPKKPEVSSEVSSEALIISNGLLNGLSGFSNWIIKFGRKELEVFLKVNAEQSPIYSHTFKIIKHLSKSRIIEVNVPLVSYRKNAHDINSADHWQKFAKSRNEVHSYTWTLNLINKLDEALKERDLKVETLRSLVEEDSVGGGFLLSSYILKRFLGSINEYPKDGVLYKEDLIKVYDFYLRYRLLSSTTLASLHLMKISALNGSSHGKLATQGGKLLKVMNDGEAILGNTNTYLGQLSKSRVYSQRAKVVLRPSPGYKFRDEASGEREVYEVDSLRKAFELNSLFHIEKSEPREAHTQDSTLIRLIQVYGLLRNKLPTWFKRLVWKWLLK